ncbi:MAG: hypothetical protein M1828_005042 [Chrysothrix sp. TS-e1954]|nr:MAG: hypothetical protein M1828_005042 [Chrysothrix sp. TS-e1954]
MNMLEPTQELESQVYKNYYSKSHTGDQGDPSEEGRTYATGETGHVDLFQDLAGSQEHRKQSQRTNGPTQLALDVSDGSDDELAPGSDADLPALTSPFRFASVTPGLAGSKRNADREVLTSEIRTPAPDLAAAFADVRMSKAPQLTQIFHETQADFSTPFHTAPNPPSDLIFDRPSPDLPRLPRSSPGAIPSSPVNERSVVHHRTSSEPYAHYLPLGESQNEWQRQRSRGSDVGDADSDNGSQGETNPFQESQIKRRSRVQQRRKAWVEMSGLSAPARRKLDGKRKFQSVETMIGVMSVTPGRNAEHAITISDNLPDGTDDEDHDRQDFVADAGSGDEYDELSQAILPSEKTSDVPGGWPITGKLFEAPAEDIARPTSSPILGKHPPDLVAQYREAGAPSNPRCVDTTGFNVSRPAFHSRKASESVAVVASQPDREEEQDENLPPRPVLPSSINSRNLISQSQSYSYNSNTGKRRIRTPSSKELEESSLPRPPMGHDASDRSGQELYSHTPCAGTPPNIPSSLKRDHDEVPLTVAEPEAGQSNTPQEQTPNASTGLLTEPRKSRQLLPQSQDLGRSGSQSQYSTRSLQRLTVPETSPAETPQHRPIYKDAKHVYETAAGIHLPSLGDHESRFSAPSNSTGAYQTARTQLPRSPSKAHTSGDNVNSQTPSKYRLDIRRMRDIVREPTPRDAGNSVDVIFDIMNDEDQEFEQAMAPKSPVRSKVRARRSSKRTALPDKFTVSTSDGPASRATHSDKENATPSPTVVHGSVAHSSLQAPARDDCSHSPSRNATSITTGTSRSVKSIRSQTSQSGSARRHDYQQASRQQTRSEALGSNDTPEVEIAVNVDSAQTAAPVGIDDVGQADQTVAPRRVLARFKGLALAFYPGTCLELSGPFKSLYKVQFDDSTIDDIEPHLVKRLDFRIGDCVKVDEKGMRQTTFVVRGFAKASEQTLDRQSTSTDVRGNHEIIVEPKQRESLPAENQPLRPRTIRVPMSSIYVPASFWSRLQARSYTHLDESEPRPPTPSVIPSIPSTPSTRTRRQAMNADVGAKSDADVKRVEVKSGIFHQMAFALTYPDTNDANRKKARLTQLIEENGGHVLASGFDLLFEHPYDGPLSALSNKTDIIATPPAELSFAAVISGSSSRRPKYMQALALNLPCIHDQWLVNSIANGAPLPWGDYLLPAGESSLLGNNIRSRIFGSPTQLQGFQATTSRLWETISRSLNFLRDRNVILVIRKVLDEQGRNLRTFLMYALGAHRVQIVKNLAAAVKLCDEDSSWNWVYIDDENGDGKLNEARMTLLGSDEPPKKKQKRSSRARKSASSTRDITVMRNESIVQSLILGRLWNAED